MQKRGRGSASTENNNIIQDDRLQTACRPDAVRRTLSVLPEYAWENLGNFFLAEFSG
jgi:hypothetical protein